jgi:hypothetical protein
MSLRESSTRSRPAGVTTLAATLALGLALSTGATGTTVRRSLPRYWRSRTPSATPPAPTYSSYNYTYSPPPASPSTNGATGVAQSYQLPQSGTGQTSRTAVGRGRRYVHLYSGWPITPLSPAPAPAPALSPTPVPAPMPTPAPVPVTIPVPVPSTIPTPTLVPTPVTPPTPIATGSGSIPAGPPLPVLLPPTPAPAPTPVPAPAPTPAPSFNPPPPADVTPAPIPAPVTAPAPAPAPAPVPVVVPAPVPAPAPAPAPSITPSTTPTSAVTVNAGGDLQAALNQAQPGDTIVLQAGATFTGPFTLPNKSGDAWITLQSSALDQLPGPGQRVGPANAPAMPRIVSPGRGQAALQTAVRANHYRIVGVEFTVADSSALVYNLISLGGGSGAQNSLGQVPHDLELDRCYIHGPSGGSSITRGIALNSAATQIHGCYIADIKMMQTDTQAIGGWNGPGPYQIVNNYLEAGAENIMFGGADPSIPGLIPSDIEIQGNYITKPLAWQGQGWTIKNLLELKNARRVRIEGNLLENNWKANQDGYAIMLSAINQNQTAPWCTLEDVTITNNIVRHSASAIDCGPGSANVVPPHQLQISNNLFEDIDGPKWGGGDGIFLRLSTTANAQIEHNTVLQSGTALEADGPAEAGFVFENNLLPHNQYGVIGADGTGIGLATLNGHYPGWVFAGNVLVGADPSLYPAENFYPGALDKVRLVHGEGSYRLAGNSPYKAAATDGSDVGVDAHLLPIPEVVTTGRSPERRPAGRAGTPLHEQ